LLASLDVLEQENQQINQEIRQATGIQVAIQRRLLMTQMNLNQTNTLLDIAVDDATKLQFETDALEEQKDQLLSNITVLAARNVQQLRNSQDIFPMTGAVFDFAQGNHDEAITQLTQLLEYNPGNTIIRIIRGELLNTVGQSEAALKDAETAIEQEPDNFVAHFTRGNILLNRREWENSIESYDTSIALAVNSGQEYSQAWANRAIALAGSGNLVEAIESQNQALLIQFSDRFVTNLTGFIDVFIELWIGGSTIQTDISSFSLLSQGLGEQGNELVDFNFTSSAFQEDDSEILERSVALLEQYNQNTSNSSLSLYQGFLLLVSGQHNEAIQQFDYILDVYSESESIDIFPSQLLEKTYMLRGIAYRNRGDLSSAISDYNEAIALRSTNPIAYGNRGLLLYSIGDWEGAIADFDSALELDPLNVNSYNNRGIIRYSYGDIEGAISDFNEAIKLNPGFLLSYRGRGIARYAQGDLIGAISDFTQAIEIDPQEATSYYYRGNALYNSGDLERAIADYSRAIELSPQYGAAYYGRGIAYRSQGNFDASIADYNVAISLNPQYSDAYGSRGGIRALQGDLEGAIADYTQAISLNPQDAFSYNSRGNARYNQGDLAGAIADYTQAIALNPQYAIAFNNRGFAYYSLEQYEQALGDFNRAVELDSRYALAFGNRGSAYRALGRYDEALANFDRALALNPNLSWVVEERNQLLQEMP